MANKPDYDLCIGADEEYAPGKRAWTKIGVGWIKPESKAVSVEISFPSYLLIGPATKIRLFRKGTLRED
jgi:hypothetical protein